MKDSDIAWTDHTFNPWCGCTKVSPGCQHCYAEKTSKRNPQALGVWGADGTRNLTNPSYWAEPIRWNAAAASNGIRTKVFCGSMCDVFEAPGTVNKLAYAGMEAARKRLFQLIDATPYLDWLLLTKRPSNIAWMWEGGPRFNVWLGTSVECQEFTLRIKSLREVRSLVPVLFISAEPLIGPVKADFSHIKWVIVGGESGPVAKVRRMDISWALSIMDQAKSDGAACYYKQHGSILAQDMAVFGTGVEQAEWPIDAPWNIRQLPSINYGTVGVRSIAKSYFDCCECDSCLNQRRNRNLAVLKANPAIAGKAVDLWKPDYSAAIHVQPPMADYDGQTVEISYRLIRKAA